MPTETIINQVPETLGLKIETERLKQEAATEKPYADHLSGGTAAEQTIDRSWVPQTAEQQRAGQTGTIELEPPDTTYSPNAEVLSQALVLLDKIKKSTAFVETLRQAGVDIDPAALEGLKEDVREWQFRDFKNKTVAAFKHLGLDTTKHFGV